MLDKIIETTRMIRKELFDARKRIEQIEQEIALRKRYNLDGQSEILYGEWQMYGEKARTLQQIQAKLMRDFGLTTRDVGTESELMDDYDDTRMLG